MTAPWLTILDQQAREKGNATVARELGISAATISMVRNGKYPAGTDKIENKVMMIYGADGQVNCPRLGNINPAQCADTWELARKIKMRAGNPATLKLYKTCLKCGIRN